MNKHFTAWAGLACAGLAQAHEGHGRSGLSHWHAVDIGVGVLLALAAATGLGLWFSRRKQGPR